MDPTRPNPQKLKNLDPTQHNPWVNPTHGQLWDGCNNAGREERCCRETADAARHVLAGTAGDGRHSVDSRTIGKVGNAEFTGLMASI